MKTNYYEILGIAPNTSKKEIRDTYIQLVKKYHPDIGGDVEKFLRIQEAYSNLIKGLVETVPKENQKGELSRAYNLYKQKRYAESSIILRNYLLNNDDDINANFLYAKIMKKFGKLHDAEIYFRKVTDKQGYNTDALFELACIYKEIGLKSRAINMLSKLLRWDENNKKALDMLNQLNKRRSIALKTIFGKKKKR